MSGPIVGITPSGLVKAITIGESGKLTTEPLSVPGLAKQLSAGASSTNQVLTATVVRVSIYASGADIRYSVGATAQTAVSTSHFIAAGERLDIGVPLNANIAAIRNASVSGVLEISELG